MSKKKTNLKVIQQAEVAAKGRLFNAPSRSAEAPHGEATTRSPIAQSFAKQVFSSEEQALEVLLEQVVSRYEQDPEEQAEMRKFLSTVLETDPDLRSEILAGAVIRQ